MFTEEGMNNQVQKYLVKFTLDGYLQVSSELGSWGFVQAGKGKIVLHRMWHNMQPDKYKVNLAIWQKT